MSSANFTIILFYKFTEITDPSALASAHRAEAGRLGLLGRMIVATEGVNATFEGAPDAIATYVQFLHSDPLFADVVVKQSAGTTDGTAFPNLSIKVRDEVVTLGAGKLDIAKDTARALSASELENWYTKDEDFVVLDLRNDYEIATGKFDRTVDPGLGNFRELPEKISEIAHLKNKRVVAVCTGGIRCEKATALLKQEGFTDLYQLQDGIHTYMQEYPGQHFKGSLFVFDNRMTTDIVEHDNKTIIGQCAFCQGPTEQYYSDDRSRPSRKVLCCDSCIIGAGVYLRPTTGETRSL